jgi:transposase-like protein
MTNKRVFRSSEEVGAILDRLEESGLSVAAFAAKEGLSPSSVHNWRHRYAKRRRSSSPRKSVLTRVGEATPTLSSASLEVVLPTGECVRVPSGFSPDDLGALLSALRSS